MTDFLLNVFFSVIIAIILLAISAGAAGGDAFRSAPVCC